MSIPIRRDAMTTIYKELVAHFGTQDETAAKLGVDQSTVSGWVRGKHGMSPVVAKRAQVLTDGKFKKEDLCPAFPWEVLSAVA